MFQKVDELDMQRILGIHSTANIFKVLYKVHYYFKLIAYVFNLLKIRKKN